MPNIPGAGGTIGLAQFVTTKKRKGHAVLVVGPILQGAIITN
jgi:putative tricarboxylic transport membrane protein